jgi:hypothetical protein
VIVRGCDLGERFMKQNLETEITSAYDQQN